MSLKIYNTLKAKKEEFKPLQAGKVGMYVCGVTVYGPCHLGHARAAITFDVIARYLRQLNYEVIYLCNYTDVDDKIINLAIREGVESDVIAKRYIREYETDMEALHVQLPDMLPKATEHIDDMIAMIETLINKGLAYELQGSVFYSVRKFADYGKLSGRKIEELETGSRVQVDENKADPLDFVLWKPAKEGEPSWKSPWSDGRPGWHIECSAMSCKYLGETFDIHGGGRDIQFPHHENEIAQSEGASGKEFARYWVHNGLLNFDSNKMSKSLGNVANVAHLLTEHDYEELRLFILANHYRSPLEYTELSLHESRESLDRFYETTARIYKSKDKSSEHENDELQTKLNDFQNAFTLAMNDDFNTAVVVGNVFEIVRLSNRFLDKSGAAPAWLFEGYAKMQQTTEKVLGIFGSDPADYRARVANLIQTKKGIDPAEISQLIAKRNEARTNKDFATSDKIRDQLLARGVEIKDVPGGKTEWKLK